MRETRLLTPLYFIKCHFDDIWYWGLWEITDLKPVNHYLNGSYTHTTITFIFDEGRETVSIKGRDLSKDLFKWLDTWNAQLREAFNSNDWNYFAEHDDFFEAHSSLKNQGYTQSITPKAWSIGLLLALLGGITISVLANGLNLFFDDKKAWEDASLNSRVSAYRKYLDDHPTGRWALEAKQRINNQYEQYSLNYQNSLSAGFDHNASTAVLGILSYANKTRQFRVRVVFERHNEIPTNIEDQLKREFSVSNVLSIGDSFSESRMKDREQQILSSVSSAFRAVIPDDVLEFGDAEADQQSVVFLITYKVKSGKSLYFRDRDSLIPSDKRPYYPGIYLEWDFEIRIPSEENGYSFVLESKPANSFGYSYSYGSETDTVTMEWQKVLSTIFEVN